MKKWSFIVVLMLFCLLFGCTAEQEQVHSAPMQPPITQRLLISSQNTEDSHTSISAEELGDSYSEGITYIGVSDLKITLGGQSYPLEDAISNGLITLEELIAYARIDARNGFCQESVESEHGLSRFVYHYYDRFDLAVYYDVFEAPDGDQHLINNVTFYQYTKAKNHSKSFHETDSNGDTFPLSREDWGLTFEIQESTRESLTLRITQAAGQQLGQLNISHLGLIRLDQEASIDAVDGQMLYAVAGDEKMDIAMDAAASVTIPWQDTFGSLEAGSYKLYILINDEYDELSVHPLMQNFQDSQGYYIYFEIP